MCLGAPGCSWAAHGGTGRLMRRLGSRGSLRLCWQVMLDRGRMRLHSGQWARARDDLLQGIEFGGNSAPVQNDLGVCSFEMGKHDDAFVAFSDALKLQANFPAAVTNRANCLREQGKLDEASADYSRAIELEGGKNEKTYVNRGVLAEQKGDIDSALADYKKALEIRPSSDVALRRLFEVHSAAAPELRLPQAVCASAPLEPPAVALQRWHLNSPLRAATPLYALRKSSRLSRRRR